MRPPERLKMLVTRIAGRPHTVALWVAVLLALSLRLCCLGAQPLWWDEGWSVYFAVTDVPTLLQLTAVDIHPPLYYLLLHLWTILLGPGVVSIRLLSVLVGTATVPLIYLAGKKLHGKKLGLVAAFLLAISPFHIFYSQEVRMYGLVTLLGLLVFLFALRLWSDEKGFGPWLGYVLAAASALYTEYYAAFLLLALNVAVLVSWLRNRGDRRRTVRWVSSQIAVLALYLPWVWYSAGKLIAYVGFKVEVEQDASLGLLTYLGRHLAAFNWGHAEGLLAGWWWLGLIPAAVLCLSFVVFVLRRGDRSVGLQRMFPVFLYCGLILAVSLSCGYVVNRALPFNPPRSERLLLLVLPAYLLLAASLLLVLWRRRRVLSVVSGASFLVVAALSLGYFHTVPRYPEDDYRPVASRIEALGLPTDAIISVHPWQVGYFTAYLAKDLRPHLFLTPREVIPRERQLWAGDESLMAADLDGLLHEHGRVWLPAHQAMGRGLESQIESYLVEEAYPVLGEWYGENTVLSLSASGDPVQQAVTAEFGDWLTLESASLSPGPLEAGWGVVATELLWRLAEGPGERYTVGLRLVDETGHVWAQRDAAPAGNTRHFFDAPVDHAFRDPHGLLIPAGTPPGEYLITLQVYRSKDTAVVPVVFEGGIGGEVVLGAIQVRRPEAPPPVKALGIEDPVRADFGQVLQLLGIGLQSEETVRPGEAVNVDLFWQALADPGEDFFPRLQLLASDGSVYAERIQKPVAGTYPTAWWRAGDLVRDPQILPVPATVPAGSYRLVLSLVRAADGSLVSANRGKTTVDLAPVQVTGREHRYEPVAPDHAQEAALGPDVELAGYDLNESVHAPASTVEVTLHWYALDTPDRNYHVFVHLLDSGGEIVAQHDGPPGEGELPALGWLPGEYLLDRHRLQLPFILPDGDYRLGIGLYDPETDQRLGERVLLDTVIEVSASQGCNCR